MKNKKSKHTGFENRVKETINLIYNNTVNEPQTEGFAKYRRNTLFTLCGSALRTMGIVENVGNGTSPRYIWTEGAPESWMVKRVVDLVREKQQHHNQKKAATKDKQVIIPVVTPVSPQPVLCLVNFTDQQIWDELKDRGYSIQNGQLCKAVYLK